MRRFELNDANRLGISTKVTRGGREKRTGRRLRNILNRTVGKGEVERGVKGQLLLNKSFERFQLLE